MPLVMWFLCDRSVCPYYHSFRNVVFLRALRLHNYYVLAAIDLVCLRALRRPSLPFLHICALFATARFALTLPFINNKVSLRGVGIHHFSNDVVILRALSHPSIPF